MKIELFGDQNRKSVIEINGRISELDICSEEAAFDDDIKVICRLHRYVDLTRVEGEVIASASLECSRCLESYREDIAGNFLIIAHHLKKGEVISDFSEYDEGEDTENLIYIAYGEDSIDINQNVHDAILLSIPLKPVCSEDCKGLCPICGNNLNESECGCNSENKDARWQAVSGLLHDSTDKNKPFFK